MSRLEELERKYNDSEILPTFTREEGIALVDLAHLVLLIDSKLTREEIEKLEERVFSLTVDGGTAGEILGSGELVSSKKLEELVENDGDRTPFIEGRTQAIDGAEHRRAALRVLATLSYADGLEEEEEGVCHEIGDAFGFDEDEIEDLLIDGAVDVWELGGDAVD